MDRLTKVWNDIKQFWSGLSRWQRLSIIGVAGAGVAVVLLLLFVGGRERYEPLFSNLDVEDQAAIVNYLKESNIPYRVDPSFNAILVPRDVVYETRLSLVGEGLPRGGAVGFELFDKMKMGMTDFQQKVGYLRALEGELTRTIQSIRGVQSCKVNIVIPEQKLFLEEQFPATASVLLSLKPGFEMGPEQVKAIVHLVSHSVEGLSPDNVVVVDSKGAILSDMLDESYFVLRNETVTSVQREMERQQELELERKARQMLERIFGPGKAVVRVRVFLNFDRRRTSTREFVPGPSGRGVPRSDQSLEETYTGPGIPPGGAPGTTTNIPGYVITPQTAGPSSYERTETTTNYEITTREQEVVYTPGGVEKITASVLVDGQLEQQMLNSLRQAVAAAIGINEERGDELYVASMPFSAMEVPAVALAPSRRWLWIILAVLLALLICGGVVFFLRKKRKEEKPETAPVRPEEGIPSLEELLKRPELLKEKGELAVLEQQLREYASKKPEEIAAIIKNWLLEDQY